MHELPPGLLQTLAGLPGSHRQGRLTIDFRLDAATGGCSSSSVFTYAGWDGVCSHRRRETGFGSANRCLESWVRPSWLAGCFQKAQAGLATEHVLYRHEIIPGSDSQHWAQLRD